MIILIFPHIRSYFKNFQDKYGMELWCPNILGKYLNI